MTTQGLQGLTCSWCLTTVFKSVSVIHITVYLKAIKAQLVAHALFPLVTNTASLFIKCNRGEGGDPAQDKDRLTVAE